MHINLFGAVGGIMFSLKINNGMIGFKDIKVEHLPEILKWYNKIDDYKFATGIDTPISIETLRRKYAEVAICSSEFFAGIYICRDNKMIGIIKGSLKYKDNDAVWISSIAIDKDLQNMGYGTLAVSMLLYYLKESCKLNSAYLAVIEDNLQGKGFWDKNNFKEVRKIESHFKLQDRKQNVIIMCRNI